MAKQAYTKSYADAGMVETLVYLWAEYIESVAWTFLLWQTKKLPSQTMVTSAFNPST